MVEGVLHGAPRGLGVILAVEIVAGAHFEDDAFHASSKSKETIAAALAITVTPEPSSFGTSSPPSATDTRAVP